MLFAEEVPISVTDGLPALSPALLIVPAVIEIPCAPVPVPLELAVIERELLEPNTDKSAVAANPAAPAPGAVIAVVAITDPVLVKTAARLIPLPPLVELFPPVQVAKTTGAIPVKAAPK